MNTHLLLIHCPWREVHHMVLHWGPSLVGLLERKVLLRCGVLCDGEWLFLCSVATDG